MTKSPWCWPPNLTEDLRDVPEQAWSTEASSPNQRICCQLPSARRHRTSPEAPASMPRWVRAVLAAHGGGRQNIRQMVLMLWPISVGQNNNRLKLRSVSVLSFISSCQQPCKSNVFALNHVAVGLRSWSIEVCQVYISGKWNWLQTRSSPAN